MQDKELDYKRFAFWCVDNEISVTRNGKPYLAVGVAYRKNKHTKISTLSVELADLNGCDSMITVGLEEFYNENCKEENNNDTV